MYRGYGRSKSRSPSPGRGLKGKGLGLPPPMKAPPQVVEMGGAIVTGKRVIRPHEADIKGNAQFPQYARGHASISVGRGRPSMPSERGRPSMPSERGRPSMPSGRGRPSRASAPAAKSMMPQPLMAAMFKPNLKRTVPATDIVKVGKANEKEPPPPNLQDMPLFRVHDSKTSKVKETKSARRLARKQSKMMSLIANQLSTERSIEPTEWLVVWGAGLAFRNKKSLVYNFFDPLPREVRFYTEKPYCTVRFASSADAEKAKTEKSGLEFVPLQPLVMGYLGEEPPAEDINITPFKDTWPKGLGLYHEFISDEEQEIIIAQLLPEILEHGTSLKNRIVKHYGYEFRYSTNDVNVDEPLGNDIPECLSGIIDRMIRQKIIPRKPEQLTLNHYFPGQGIPPHVDTHSAFETPIVSVSLNAPIVIDFREAENHVSVVLPPRSLLVMDDESRYQWTHGIASRGFDLIPDQIYGGGTIIERRERTSLTFRLLRASRECDCSFPDFCDTQQNKINAENAARIESELVHKVYDHIAPHFDQTRHSPWPKVKEFIEKIAPGQCLLDVGCGNGKYFNLTDYIYEVGTDMSTELLNIAQAKKTAEGVRSHCMRLPFRDNCFDATICIAVLHHLATKERRIEALKEILRVTSPGGEGLIYVWAKNQRLNEVKSVYYRQKELKNSYNVDPPTECVYPVRRYQFLPVHQPGTDFEHNDVLVPWTTKIKGRSELHHRFYHVFVRGELDDLLRQVKPPPRIMDSYYDQGNWCVRFQKDVFDAPPGATAAGPK